MPDFDSRVVIFVWPDSAQLDSLRNAMGEDFYVAADDENFYRAAAFTLLDSLGIPHRTLDRGPMRFLVDGTAIVYEWEEQPVGWFVVVYDGARAPRVTSSVELTLDTSWISR